MNPFIGQIMLFAGNFAPRTWAFCDGALLAISSNTALFSILGTTYGGDGRTTFGLPDLRGRVPVGPRRGPGLSTYDLGERGGAETAAVALAQLPSHSHTPMNNAGAEQHVTHSTAPATNEIPAVGDVRAVANFTEAGGFGATNVKSFGELTGANAISGQTLAADAGLTINNTGSTQAHYNLQPFEAVNYIIAMFGTYPSRS
tara:strand:- start:322 stop:924 length:603 start_codon:yes stop_codon:yes gene_type:complete